jgi:hypothetical protein
MSENLTICDISSVLISKEAHITIILSTILAIFGIMSFACKEIIREIICDWFKNRNEKDKAKQNIFEVPTAHLLKFHEYLDSTELEKNYSNSNILKYTDRRKYNQSYFEWLGTVEKE